MISRDRLGYSTDAQNVAAPKPPLEPTSLSAVNSYGSVEQVSPIITITYREEMTVFDSSRNCGLH